MQQFEKIPSPTPDTCKGLQLFPKTPKDTESSPGHLICFGKVGNTQAALGRKVIFLMYNDNGTHDVGNMIHFFPYELPYALCNMLVYIYIWVTDTPYDWMFHWHKGGLAASMIFITFDVSHIQLLVMTRKHKVSQSNHIM